jgi:hypothetical protein
MTRVWHGLERRRSMTWLNRLFRLEQINGGTRCPTYLYRWTVFQPRWGWLKGFGIYLHRFVAEDWSRDMHDHPKRFISVGLSGGYVEHTPNGSRTYRAPWIRSFPAKHIHRITLGQDKECWTLVIVLRATRPWGFWHAGSWIPWKEYVFGTHAVVADEMVACK